MAAAELWTLLCGPGELRLDGVAVEGKGPRPADSSLCSPVYGSSGQPCCLPRAVGVPLSQQCWALGPSGVSHGSGGSQAVLASALGNGPARTSWEHPARTFQGTGQAVQGAKPLAINTLLEDSCQGSSVR